MEKITKDLSLARKKKQALDDLFDTGKISASTYESFDKELVKTISEIEARQKDLADKMTSKITDLEKQIGTLEIFLANSEIQYAAGETDEESHASEIGAFSLGLDVVKQELGTIKEVVANLMPGVVAPPPPSTSSEVVEAPTTEEIVEESTEIPVETPIETPVEEITEAETASEKVTVNEPLETSTEEPPSEEVTEVTTAEVVEVSITDETVALPEPPVEETRKELEVTEIPPETETEEIVTEEVVAEEEVEEEIEASAEETSSQEEEEETNEE